jgi:hypothetical protein
VTPVQRHLLQDDGSGRATGAGPWAPSQAPPSRLRPPQAMRLPARTAVDARRLIISLQIESVDTSIFTGHHDGLRRCFEHFWALRFSEIPFTRPSIDDTHGVASPPFCLYLEPLATLLSRANSMFSTLNESPNQMTWFLALHAWYFE